MYSSVICYHCKRRLTRKLQNGSCYVSYWTKTGQYRRRSWCHDCNRDVIVDAEYPKEGLRADNGGAKSAGGRTE